MNLKSTAGGMILATLVPLLSTGAATVPMDELIKKEQTSVDNEAVVVYGGKIGNLQARKQTCNESQL
ncbi:MAG: hypothetical protein NTV46_10940 [Verrucomicrobia bacterium]|nr:hypothetical protein [Verrucomicrobiota bacterium]